jgi:prepilin-type N-terminal cleavage/methylation domain-containing protein
MRRIDATRRRAFTLLEVIAAAAIMATLTTASFALLRTSHNAWLRHRDDSAQRREALAAMQHIMRRVRQATRVTAISTAVDTSGGITLLMPGGTTAIWDHNSGTNQALYGTTTPTNLLAAGITEMTFVGLKADGSTATTQTDLIHAVHCTLKFALSRPAGSVTETISCQAWLRAW